MTDGIIECIDLGKDYLDMNIPSRVLKYRKEEKSNKCNQCDYASFQAGGLKQHFERHSGDKIKKADSVILV